MIVDTVADSTGNGAAAVCESGTVLPKLRAAIADLPMRDRVALAMVATCNSGGAVADPEVLSAIRLSFVEPERGDEPDSVLVRAIADAGWTETDVAEVSLAIWQLGEHHPRPEFWTALASEVAAAGAAATRRCDSRHSSSR